MYHMVLNAVDKVIQQYWEAHGGRSMILSKVDKNRLTTFGKDIYSAVWDSGFRLPSL